MLLFLLLFAPGAAAAFLYDRFSPGQRPPLRVALAGAAFALVSNLLAFAAFALRGYETIFLPEQLESIPFLLWYAGVSLACAGLLAAMAIGAECLLQGGKGHE